MGGTDWGRYCNFRLPYRIGPENNTHTKKIRFGSNEIAYTSDIDKNLFTHELEIAETRNLKGRRSFSYPIIAGSSGTSQYYENKYELVTTLSTWDQAIATAKDMGGRLVSIESEAEQTFVVSLLKEVEDLGLDDKNNPLVSYGWLGASDNEDENGVLWNQALQDYDTSLLNASEGAWRWLYGAKPVENYYQNWVAGAAPENNIYTETGLCCHRLGISRQSLVGPNASYRLPFVVEFDNVSDPAPVQTPLSGIRKVLYIPARFQDEGEHMSQ